MPNRIGVPMIDHEHIRRIFGEHVMVVPSPHGVRVCLECATLGHICRRCREERYHARLAAQRKAPRRLGAWWRSTPLYAMNRDYPVSTPLVFAAGVVWGVLCLVVPAILVVGL